MFDAAAREAPHDEFPGNEIEPGAMVHSSLPDSAFKGTW
jgi:hypothetical protein